jgi:hypothetical protein
MLAACRNAAMKISRVTSPVTGHVEKSHYRTPVDLFTAGVIKADQLPIDPSKLKRDMRFRSSGAMEPVLNAFPVLLVNKRNRAINRLRVQLQQRALSKPIGFDEEEWVLKPVACQFKAVRGHLILSRGKK